jgi:hypothetical protein
LSCAFAARAGVLRRATQRIERVTTQIDNPINGSV